MITKKQLDKLSPKPFEPIGKKKIMMKENGDFEEVFIPKKEFAPELGKYVDKKARGYYTNSELKKIK